MKIFCLSIFGAVFLLVPQLKAAVIAQWRFENNLNDSSGNALNMGGGAGFSYSTSVPGTTINPGAIPDTASYVVGPKATPISLAANTLMTDTFSYGSFTLQAFVQLTGGASNFRTILWNQSGNTGSYFSVGPSSSYFDSYNGTGGLAGITVGTGLSLDVWHHVAWVGTYDPGNGTVVQYYEDGAAVGAVLYLNKAASGEPRAHIAPSTADWRVGGTSGNEFSGMIDMLQLDNTALTPGRV